MSRRGYITPKQLDEILDRGNLITIDETVSAEPKPKKKKYNNRKVVIDDIEFDSTVEANRYRVLKAAQEEGLIHTLQTQPEFKITPFFVDCLGRSHTAQTYQADFSYIMTAGEIYVIEDVKGMRLRVYINKIKVLTHRSTIFARAFREVMQAGAYIGPPEYNVKALSKTQRELADAIFEGRIRLEIKGGSHLTLSAKCFAVDCRSGHVKNVTATAKSMIKKGAINAHDASLVNSYRYSEI